MALSDLVQHLGDLDSARNRARLDAKVFGGQYTHVSDRTPSMLGSGLAGSEIAIVPERDYGPGDMAVYKSAMGGRVLHEITATKPGYAFFKGSFNQNGDGWVPVEDIIGRVLRGYKQ